MYIYVIFSLISENSKTFFIIAFSPLRIIYRHQEKKVSKKMCETSRTNMASGGKLFSEETSFISVDIFLNRVTRPVYVSIAVNL